MFVHWESYEAIDLQVSGRQDVFRRHHHTKVLLLTWSPIGQKQLHFCKTEDPVRRESLPLKLKGLRED